MKLTTNYNFYISLAFLIILSTSYSSFAQKQEYFKSENEEYNRAKELFNKQKYSNAQEIFLSIVDQMDDLNTQLKSNSAYYAAQCAVELFNPDAEYLTTEFLKNYPENPYFNLAKYNLANYYYRDKQYRNSIKWLEEVEIMDLSEDKQVSFHFIMGYSHFMMDNIDEARLSFFEIKDKESKYRPAALYYYSHINYTQKNYQTALDGFLLLQDDETFSTIVPYYISQVYYLQEKYKSVVEFAPSFLEKVTEKRKAEVARIIGESYFNLKKYEEAIPFYKIYLENVKYAKDEDFYQLGYAFYSIEDYEEASEIFEKLSNQNSLIAQNASYHLADCYIKLGKKNKALVAFSNASKLDYDPGIKEDALFNYAVASYELSYSPFSEAIRNFSQYINLYPESRRIDEAYHYLVLAYLNTKNYRYALTSIQKIKNKSYEVLEAYQRIAYYRGIELFNNLTFNEAIEKFNLSLEYGKYDNKLRSLAIYWRGESQFRLKQYDEAIKDYKKFLVTPGAFTLDVYNITNYNIGYSYFKLKQYDDAILYLRKYLSGSHSENKTIISDASIRIADCYFVKGEYMKAVDFYDKAVQLNEADADYAFFQKGFTHGIMDHHDTKINILNQLVKSYPNSGFSDDAVFEIGKSYMALQDQESAKTYYIKILSEFPNSSYLKSSLVQLGLIHYNQDRYFKALEYYKKVITEFPGTQEAKNSLTGVKNIYIELNEIEKYFTYVNSLGGIIDVSRSEQDSLTYVSAENLYMNGQFDKAGQKLENYINQFPDGSFLLNAHFYLAESFAQLDKPDKALVAYNYVIEKSKNIFTELALLGASRINYSQEQYQLALENYKALENMAETNSNLLEARLGILRCNYHLNNYTQTIESANKVLATEKLADEFKTEAQFKKANAYYEIKDFDNALNAYAVVARNVKKIEGAESKYRMTEILFKQDKIDKAEKEIFDFIDQNTPHQYWMARAYILLADIFMKKDDNFQAMHTLKSIIDYYEVPDDGIIKMAKEKKERILEDEMIQYSEEDADIEISIDEE